MTRCRLPPPPLVPLAASLQDGRDLLRLLWSVTTVGHDAPLLQRRLLVRLATKAGQLSCAGVGQALVTLAHCRFSGSSMSGSRGGISVWSRDEPGGALLARLYTVSRRKLPNFPPAALAQTLVGLAGLQCGQPPAGATALAASAAGTAPPALPPAPPSPPAPLPPPAEWLDALLLTCHNKAPNFNPRQAADALAALSRLGAWDQGLWRRLATVLTPAVSIGKALAQQQQLQAGVAGDGGKGRAQEALQRVDDETVLAQLSDSQLAALLAALAAARYRHVGLASAAAAELALRLPSAVGRDVAPALRALVCLNVRCSGLIAALRRQVIVDAVWLSGWSAADVASVAWFLAVASNSGGKATATAHLRVSERRVPEAAVWSGILQTCQTFSCSQITERTAGATEVPQAARIRGTRTTGRSGLGGPQQSGRLDLSPADLVCLCWALTKGGGLLPPEHLLHACRALSAAAAAAAGNNAAVASTSKQGSQGAAATLAPIEPAAVADDAESGIGSSRLPPGILSQLELPGQPPGLQLLKEFSTIADVLRP